MRLLDSYSDFLIKHRRWVVLFVVVLTIVTGIGHLRNKAERFSGIKSLATSRDDIREADELYQELREQFDVRRPDQLIVMSSPNVLDAIDLRAMRRAVGAVKSLPQVKQAIWVDDLPVLNIFGLADPLLPPDGSSDEGYEEGRKRVLESPIAVGQLISEDGRVLVVPVQMEWLEVTSDEQAREEVLQAAIDGANEVEGHRVSFTATGDIPLFLDQMRAHRENEKFFQRVGYTLVLILAIVIYRSFVPVILVASAPAMAIFWTLGILRWLGEPANPLSDSVLPVLIAIVGITDGVHLLAHLRRRFDETQDPQLAASSAVRHVGLACFLTSLTTAIGFASLMTADANLVQGFGRASSIGVCMAFIAMVTVLPLLAGTRLAKKLPPANEEDEPPKGNWRWQNWVEVWLKHRKVVSCIGILLTALLCTSLLRLNADEKRSYGLPAKSPSFRALKLCDESIGGIDQARIVIEWDSEEALTVEQEQRIRDVVSEVELALADEPLLQYPLSINQVLSAMTGADNSDRPLDFLTLLPGPVRDAVFREDLRRTMVSVRFQDVGIAKYEPVLARLRTRFDEVEADYPGMSIRLTGEAVVRARKIAQVVKDLQRSLIGAGIIIFSLLAVVYRSIRIGLIAIVPNLLPIVATATLLVVLGRNLDVSAACAFTVCLGIAVDDTIHFVSRYLQERQRQSDPEVAIRVTYRKVGSALIVTTIIMVFGFSTVLLSEMPAQQIFGAMAVCTIATALFGDLIFLPALLAWFGPPASRSIATQSAETEPTEAPTPPKSTRT